MRMRPMYPRLPSLVVCYWKMARLRLRNEPVICPRHRQRYPKPRALGTTQNVDPAVVRVDDLPHDRQAEARALRLGREERVENSIAQILRHARPVVCDVDHDRAGG